MKNKVGRKILKNYRGDLSITSENCSVTVTDSLGNIIDPGRRKLYIDNYNINVTPDPTFFLKTIKLNNSDIDSEFVYNLKFNNNLNIEAKAEAKKFTSATNFKINAGMITSYTGTDGEVIIPETYSVENYSEETLTFSTKNEAKAWCDSDNNYPYTFIDATGAAKTVSSSAMFILFFATYPITLNITRGTIIDGTDFTISSISDRCFSSNTTITKVDIPGSIKSIGMSCFYNCTNLKEAILGDGVETLGESAFEGCSSLESLYISNTLASCGLDIVTGCSKLSKIIISDIDRYAEIQFKSSTAGYNSFLQLPTAKLYMQGSDIAIENITLSKDTNISSTAFAYYTYLKSVTFEDGTISISGFNHCTNLNIINVPSSVKWVDSFGYNTGYYNKQTANKKYLNNNILWKYSSASGSISIDEGIEITAGSAFIDYGNITSVTFPTTLKYIGRDLFQLCSTIKTLTLKSVNPPEVDSYLGRSLELTAIYVPQASVDLYKQDAFWSTYANIIIGQ